jgi:hypothetical protein
MIKKNIIKYVGVSALVISAPFAVLAVSSGNLDELNSSVENFIKQNGHNRGNSDHQKNHKFDKNTNDLLTNPSYENQFSKLELEIENKVEKANEIIEVLELSADIETQLSEIIEDYSELEVYLESLEIESTQSDLLKEIFIESKIKSLDLEKEFREIIQENLNETELEDLKSELEPIKSQTNHPFGHPNEFNNNGDDTDSENLNKNNKQHGKQGNFLPFELIEQALPETAEQLESGEITLEQAHDQIKEYLDSLTQEQKEELRQTHLETGKN